MVLWHRPPVTPPGQGTRTGGSGRLHTFLKYLFPEKLKPRLTAQKRALNMLVSGLPSPHCCLACVLNWEHPQSLAPSLFHLILYPKASPHVMNSDSETSLLMIVEFNGYKFYHNLSDHFPVVKHLDGFWFFSLFKLCCGEYPSTSFDF